MRKRLWFSSFAVAVIAVLIVGVPALVIAARRGAAAVGVIVAAMAAAAALAGWLTAVLAGRLGRPVEELAEAAARLGRGDPRPLGRRYGVADLDQVADGLDRSARRLSSLLRRRSTCTQRQLVRKVPPLRFTSTPRQVPVCSRHGRRPGRHGCRTRLP